MAQITKVSNYEVGKNNVANIEIYSSDDKRTTYKITDYDGNIIVYLGLLIPHEIQKER